MFWIILLLRLKRLRQGSRLELKLAKQFDERSIYYVEIRSILVNELILFWLRFKYFKIYNFKSQILIISLFSKCNISNFYNLPILSGIYYR